MRLDTLISKNFYLGKQDAQPARQRIQMMNYM